MISTDRQRFKCCTDSVSFHISIYMAANFENSEDHSKGGIGGCDDAYLSPITESPVDPIAFADYTLQHGTCGCKWNSCVKKMRAQFASAAVVERFWKRYNQMNHQNIKDECDAPDSSLHNNICINLGTLQLCLGLAPKYGFNYVSCLHTLNSSDFEYMDPCQLELLFYVLRDIVRDIENVANDAPNFHEDQNRVLSFMLFQRIRSISADHYSPIFTSLNMFNNFRTAKMFVKFWPFISNYRKQFDLQTKLCQQFFVEALFVYSEEDKILLQRHTSKVRQFFMYASGLGCNCVSDKVLLLNIAVKWAAWFYFCARKLREMIPFN